MVCNGEQGPQHRHATEAEDQSSMLQLHSHMHVEPHITHSILSLAWSKVPSRVEFKF